MITVNIDNQNWKFKVQQEFEKIGLKLKKRSMILDECCKFEIGSRTFEFDKNFTRWNGPKKILKTDASQFEFDDEKFKEYIDELNEKKVERNSNRAAFKFLKEYFTIRLGGSLKNIHSSFSNLETWDYDFKMYSVSFNMFNCRFTISKLFNYPYDELNELELWDEEYSFKIDAQTIGIFTIEQILERLRNIRNSYDKHFVEITESENKLKELKLEIDSAINFRDRDWYINEKLKLERDLFTNKEQFKNQIKRKEFP